MAEPTAECQLAGLPAEMLTALSKLAEQLDRREMKVTSQARSRTRALRYSIFTRAFAGGGFASSPSPSDGTDRGISEAMDGILQAAVAENPEVDRAVGAMIGNALGDSLGHPLEFIAVDESPDLGPQRPHLDPEFLTAAGAPLYWEEENRFNLKPGQWTDDFSMALCLADSLLVHRYYHGADARVRWYNWWHNGYNNGFRFDSSRGSELGTDASSVGLGGNISKSINDLELYRINPDAIPPYYQSEGEDAGNGSIMRLSPVPIMFHFDVALAEDVAVQQSRGTHPGNDAAASCRFITFFIVQAIKSGLPSAVPGGPATPTQQFVDQCVADFIRSHDLEADSGMRKLKQLLASAEAAESKEVCWNWKLPQLPISQAIRNRRKEGSYNGYPVLPSYWGSYCLDGLAMALWGVYHTTCFEAAVLKVVNLLGDADSTGAVAGQMAGALYGYQSLKGANGSRPVKYKVRQVESDCTADTSETGDGKGSAFQSMGESWLHHLRRWDPYSEVPLRAVLLYCLQPKQAPERDDDSEDDEDFEEEKAKEEDEQSDGSDEDEQQEEKIEEFTDDVETTSDLPSSKRIRQE
uniref:ADP-ribosylglycohydrolase n=1 Tax=Eutreptiella gymnastica TaxID=73025 RepID=A0A7S1HTZ1_9EUGL|mmetsp:Transcript_105602/g.182083  ORF Transcript_105602/g.182083 Transcript_105602/m.182083 type:complete len:580 (+) Transcript_105602:29-1768(+)